MKSPFYAPNVHFHALECPDIFNAQGRWYAIYTSDRRTFYRTVDKITGPWQAVGPDSADHYFKGIYAPKTLSDGQRRFLFGWIGTRSGENDDGDHEWGGDMLIPRELLPLPGGELAQICPAEILAACGPNLEIEIDSRLGHWQRLPEKMHGQRVDGLAYAALNNAPSSYLLECSVTFAPGTNAAGIMFRAHHKLSTCHSLRLEPVWHRVVLERWELTPRKNRTTILAERPLTTIPGKSVSVQLFVGGDIIEAFIDGRSALCGRGYDFQSGESGLFVEHGEAAFSHVHLRQLPV